MHNSPCLPATAGRSGTAASAMHGFSLVYVVIVITVVAALAAALVSITSTTQFGQLREHSMMQARYMAMAGLSYLNSMPSQHRSLRGKTIEVEDDEGNVIGSYTFQSVQRLTNLQVRASILGTAGNNTAYEATYYLEGEAQEDFSGIASSVQSDFEDFTVTNSNPNVAGTDTIDGRDDIGYNTRASRGSAAQSGSGSSDGTEVTETEVEGPNAFSVGAGDNYNFGIATFTGNRTFQYNTCVDGECDFFLGMRFFMTVWYSQNDADGLVITLFNGDNNTWRSVGGDSQWGEMIGYAGDSRVLSSTDPYSISRFVDPEANGLQPPKLGVEIDNYGNPDRWICRYPVAVNVGTSRRPSYNYDYSVSQYWYRKSNPQGGRYDYGGSGGGSGADHMAFVAWGLETPWGCAQYVADSTTVRSATSGGLSANAAGAATYDDNFHSRESWLWNPWHYQNPIANRSGEVTMYNTSRRRVAQTFYVEEPLRVSEAHIYLSKSTSIADQGAILRASIYAASSSGGGHVPSGTALAQSISNSTDYVTDSLLPIRGSSTSECIYGDGSRVLVNFQFRSTWSTSSTASYLTPGWYALVLEYSSTSGNVNVQVDDTSPTHPGNFATYNGSTWSVDTARDMIFYVLFDPPNSQRTGSLISGGSPTYESAVFPLLESTSYDNGGESQGNATDWRLLEHRMAVRMEVHRGVDDDPDATNSDGTHGSLSNGYHPYRMIVWIRRCNPDLADEEASDGCDSYINSYFADTSGDLDTDLNPPAMERTFYLNDTDHAKFDTFLLGISEATGGSTQDARFDNIIMQFRTPDDEPLNVRACRDCNDFDD